MALYLILVTGLLSVSQTLAQGNYNGFLYANGNCRSQSRPYQEIQDSGQGCAFRCQSDPNCCGFTFTPSRSLCQLRGTQDFCQTIVPEGDRFYFRKLDAGFQPVCSAGPPGPPSPPGPPGLPGPPGTVVTCDTTNEGKEFWLMFMENKADQPDPTVPLEMFITPGKATAAGIEVSVTVEWQFPPGGQETKRVRPNEVVRFTLDRSMKLTGTGIEKKGVKVTATDNIVMYGVNKDRFTADGFLALPIPALGQRYLVVTYAPPTWQCEFGIAAIFDGTEVTITLPRDVKYNNPCGLSYQGQTITNGQTFRVSMNKWDAFQAQDGNKCDLTGTIIESTRAVSVFSGNMRTFIGIDATQGGEGLTRDHLVEQMVPEQSWGSDFVTVPIPDRQVGDVWIFVAAEDGTSINIVNQNGQREVIQLNQGQSSRKALGPGLFWHVKSNKQIMATQLVTSQSASRDCAGNPGPTCHDPAMILYTPIQQFGFGYSFTTPSAVATKYINRLLITIEAGRQDGLRLDGQRLPGNNQWINCGDSTYVGAAVPIPQGTHTIVHQDTSVPFGTYLYGAGDRESYGLPTGMCIKVLRCRETFMQIGDRRDNDCDDRIDEEVCQDNIDNDGDGRMDEDCGSVFVPTTPPPIRAQCGVAEQVTICMGKQETISCPQGRQIRIIEAHFGRIGYSNERTCENINPFDCANTEVDCGWYSIYPAVASRCEDQNQCLIPANSYFIGSCAEMGPCKQCSKYITISWLCTEQQQQCRVLSGVQYKSFSDLYYSSSSHSKSGAPSGFCECTSGQCERGCAAAKMDPRATKCFAEKAQFSSGATEAWCPAQCDVERPYLRVDLGSHYRVTGFVVQGRRRWDQWVEKIGFQYSDDNQNWRDLNEGGRLKEFDANSNARGIRWCYFGNAEFTARYVRVVVLAYKGYPAMHVDMLRCQQYVGCNSMNPENSEYAITGISAMPGQQVRVKCNALWMTQQQQMEFTMSCQINGQWQGADNCNTPRECPNIPRVQGALHNGQSTKLGTQVTYSCQQGRFISGGSGVITCQPNGQWSTPPRCQ